MKKNLRALAFLPAIALLGMSTVAQAEIKVGAIFSLTGSAAAQGIPQQQALELGLPAEIGGEKVTTIVLDDASDPAVAVRNARKLIEEDKVDVIIGPVLTPNCVAVAQVTSEAGVPHFTLAPVDLGADRNGFLFVVPPPPKMTMYPNVLDMKKRGVKTVGYLGFSDSWGDATLAALKGHAEEGGYTIVAEERYARSDTSVTGQVLRLLSANPDAVVLGVAGTPGVVGNVTIVERGFTGPIYNTNGVFNAEFLTLGGAELEGVHGTTGAINVWQALPDSEARKAVSKQYAESFLAKFGKGSYEYGGFTYDAALVAAAGAELAVKEAKPGTPEFRKALAASIRTLKQLPGVHSTYTYSDPTSPFGAGPDAAFLVQVHDGKWVMAN